MTNPPIMMTKQHERLLLGLARIVRGHMRDGPGANGRQLIMDIEDLDDLLAPFDGVKGEPQADGVNTRGTDRHTPSYVPSAERGQPAEISGDGDYVITAGPTNINVYPRGAKEPIGKLTGLLPETRYYVTYFDDGEGKVFSAHSKPRKELLPNNYYIAAITTQKAAAPDSYAQVRVPENWTREMVKEFTERCEAQVAAFPQGRDVIGLQGASIVDPTVPVRLPGVVFDALCKACFDAGVTSVMRPTRLTLTAGVAFVRDAWDGGPHREGDGHHRAVVDLARRHVEDER